MSKWVQCDSEEMYFNFLQKQPLPWLNDVDENQLCQLLFVKVL